MEVTTEMIETLKNEGVERFLNELAYNTFDDDCPEYGKDEVYTEIIDTLNSCDAVPDFACVPWGYSKYSANAPIESGVDLPHYDEIFNSYSDSNSTGLIQRFLTYRSEPQWWAGSVMPPTNRTTSHFAACVRRGYILNLSGESIINELDVYPVLHLVKEEEIGDTFEYNGIKFLVTKPQWAIALQSIGKTIYDDTSSKYKGSKLQKFIEDWFNR